MRLAQFRDCHRGATLVVCGCGSSLALLEQPQRLLTIGVNDVGRSFDPTYLVVVNPPRQFAAGRFEHVRQSRARALFTQLDLGPVRPPVVRLALGTFGGTEPRGDALPYTQNSPYVAVCLAAWMGAARIGLIGVDFTDHHFFGPTGRHPLAGQLAVIDAQYGRLAQALAAKGVELVNLSPDSRLGSLPRQALSSFDALPLRCPKSGGLPDSAQPSGGQPSRLPGSVQGSLRIVSYATTPLAGVPAILARCIAAVTGHEAHCVWTGGSYRNGSNFPGGTNWLLQPQEALALLEAADVVIAHNGKLDPAHRRVLAAKPVLTLAHNYGWNVDMQHWQRGQPGLVVGQYQATLPEFAGWRLVPNPMPLWEPGHASGEKGERVHIAYTPSGRHERYPVGHRLYWHGKGFDSTMAVLRRLARLPDVRIEATANGQVDHEQALAMKRRAHIVIDECVTGSYHRNSLEGLAAGAVVVNGVGLLPEVVRALRACAPEAGDPPFVFSDLSRLEAVLRELITLGAPALAARGRDNREWMLRHWDFAAQWERFWQPAIEAALQSPQTISAANTRISGARTVTPATAVASGRRSQRATTPPSGTAEASVVVPHGGSARLPLLAATLASLRQERGATEAIVVELGERPLAAGLAARWQATHLFIAHRGPFERAKALNAGAAIAAHEILIWHDNDLLLAPGFIERCAREIRERKLDYLVPYTSIRYLGAEDSSAVLRGEADPCHCTPVNRYASSGPGAGWFGSIGVVRRSFVEQHGGLIEGFVGWGGEDNAWFHKLRLLGRTAATSRKDQHVYHLYHPGSGGYGMAEAGAGNPHYADNAALLQRVCALRSAAMLRERFPPVAPATGVLTCPAVPGTATASVGRAAAGAAEEPLPVWTYWEGPCPSWIRACRRTIERHAPNLRLLSPRTFDLLRDQDRDIDLSHLHVAHRADYIRAFLLQRYGGLWIDADCLAMQSLQPVLDLLAQHDFVGHRVRTGVISNAFIAAPPGSRIAAEYYERVRHAVRTKMRFAWNWLGGDLLTEVVARDPSGWHELPCERIQPICWSRPQDFLAVRQPSDHERVFDGNALCYMLSNVELGKRCPAAGSPAGLLGERTFFAYLLRRVLGDESPIESIRREDIFATQTRLFRQYGCESGSGTGSSLQQTQAIRRQLPLLLQHLGVDTLLDAPCGDCHWMRELELGATRYIGADLLGELVADNQALYGNGSRRFVRADLIGETLPRADAILCRDLLPHLSFAEIRGVLRNFVRSGARYLITTTFTGDRPNRDTAKGAWRPLNLGAEPFDLGPPAMTVNEQCSENNGAYRDKCLGVWRLENFCTS